MAFFAKAFAIPNLMLLRDTFSKFPAKYSATVMKTILLIAFVHVTTIALSQSEIVKFKVPSSVSAAKGYSHSAVIDLGTCQMIVLAGQVPIDKEGNLVGKGDLAKQTEQVFLNIKNILSESGATMNDLIKLGIYMTDVSQLQSLRTVRDRFVNTQKPPVSTLVQVSKLFRDDVMIEIEATAIVPKK